MEIHLTLTSEEWYKFQKFIQRKNQKDLNGVIGGFWANLALFFVLTFIFVVLFNFIDRFHYPTAIFFFVIFSTIIGLFFWNIYRLQRSFVPSENGIFVGEHNFTFDEKGIRSEGKGYRSFHEWRVVKTIMRENGMIMIFLDTANAFIFPETQLSDPDVFLHTIRGYRRKHSAEMDSGNGTALTRKPGR